MGPRDDTLFQVAAEISMGTILLSRSHSVGPYRVALREPAQWACLDRTGMPIDILEEWEHAVSLFETARFTRPDRSAFGAAKAFIAAVGEKAARHALDNARRQKRAAHEVRFLKL